MSDPPRQCDTHLDIVGFKYPPPNLAQSLKHRRKTRIVAIGSSSTAGEALFEAITEAPRPRFVTAGPQSWHY